MLKEIVNLASIIYATFGKAAGTYFETWARLGENLKFKDHKGYRHLFRLYSCSSVMPSSSSSQSVKRWTSWQISPSSTTRRSTWLATLLANLRLSCARRRPTGSLKCRSRLRWRIKFVTPRTSNTVSGYAVHPKCESLIQWA